MGWTYLFSSDNHLPPLFSIVLLFPFKRWIDWLCTRFTFLSKCISKVQVPSGADGSRGHDPGASMQMQTSEQQRWGRVRRRHPGPGWKRNMTRNKDERLWEETEHLSISNMALNNTSSLCLTLCHFLPPPVGIWRLCRTLLIPVFPRASF